MSQAHTKILVALSAVLLAGSACDPGETTAPPSGRSSTSAVDRTQHARPPRAQSDALAERDSDEATAAALRPLLLARHAKDAPNPQTLDAHGDAAAGLRWLADHDSTMLVRARALSLLRHYPERDNEALLVAVLNDPAVHRKLRSAAVGAMRGWDLDERDDLRALVVSAVSSPDASVALAAARTLGGVQAAQPDLTALIESGTLAPSVHEAAARATVATDAD